MHIFSTYFTEQKPVLFRFPNACEKGIFETSLYCLDQVEHFKSFFYASAISCISQSALYSVSHSHSFMIIYFFPKLQVKSCPDHPLQNIDSLSGLEQLDERFNQLRDSDLMKVVHCMEHAIASIHPRYRYSPGWDAKFLWLPMSYMPTWISDRFFLRYSPKPKVSMI